MPKARRIKQELIWKTTEEMEEFLRPKPRTKLEHLVVDNAPDEEEALDALIFVRNIARQMNPIYRYHELLLAGADPDIPILLEIIKQVNEVQALIYKGLCPGPMQDAYIEMIRPAYLQWKELMEKNAALAEAELVRRGMNGHGQV
jgi:hypothetical protein